MPNKQKFNANFFTVLISLQQQPNLSPKPLGLPYFNVILGLPIFSLFP